MALIAAFALVFVGVTFSAAAGTVKVSGAIEVDGALPETRAIVMINGVGNDYAEERHITIGSGITPWDANIPEGTYTFGLMAPGAGIQTYYAGQPTQDDADPVVVGPDGLGHLDFDTIVSTGSSISGTVVDIGGMPVAGAYVQLDGVDRYTYSADDGTFSLVNLPLGSYVVSILVDDVPVGELSAEIPEDGTIVTDVTITTTVVPAPTETPSEPETTAPTEEPTLTASTPTISDTTPQVGQKLTVAPGSWTSGTAFAYEWLRGTTVVGKTSTYTPIASDLGKTLTVKVTGTKSGYTSVTKTSAATKPVAAGTLKTATPTISGTAKVGVKLTAKAGSWTSGTSLTYRWYASGKAISGATKSTFTPTATQLNKTLTVKVTGSRSGYTAVAKTSKATAKVKAGTLTSTPTPKISGTTKVGKTVTAKAGTWKPSGGKVTYQWYRGGSKISKATKSTYKLVSADKGRTIKVKVTYTKSGYTTVSKTSKATAKIS
ncbi:carboxypeptidase regulatory-like domain-containing protein [Tessaracoccus palaemonis]|uniref:Carboxypeptidase-like regulatory domain-containing protein n=1 Tax=Tessaracoccus palaemonis TaxID=2829499 RepID=A0ABX8SJI8_9ACTN|nr:carboxypeptidase regulatory-like domain-containing protein [Tessaracoccus palaemonis]QXT63129.1 carboxypeptidase-like regulatory domain-containing protein [Tessaracoccus palaemonis]